MIYEVKLARKAFKRLSKLPPKIQEQIKKKIDNLAKNPRPASSTELRRDPSKRRLRSGDYRIIYEIRDKKVIVLVLQIGDRKEIYRIWGRK